MTTQEFSLEFDLQYNNIMSDVAPGLNEWEKSVFLTRAQEQLVLSLYNGQISSPFEQEELVRQCLSALVKQVTLSPDDSTGLEPISDDSFLFKIPEDVWLKTYEKALLDDAALLCGDKQEVEAAVFPVSQDEYNRTVNSPFRGSTARRVLRLERESNIIELISKYNVKYYTLRYIRHPNPIILEDLPDGLYINGKNKQTECELNDIIHKAILSSAVLDAQSVWITNNNNNTN